MTAPDDRDNHPDRVLGTIILLLAVISVMTHIWHRVDCGSQGGSYERQPGHGFVCVLP